jgi:hypothetical protein
MFIAALAIYYELAGTVYLITLGGLAAANGTPMFPADSYSRLAPYAQAYPTPVDSSG